MMEEVHQWQKGLIEIGNDYYILYRNAKGPKHTVRFTLRSLLSNLVHGYDWEWVDKVLFILY